MLESTLRYVICTSLASLKTILVGTFIFKLSAIADEFLSFSVRLRRAIFLRASDRFLLAESVN